MIPSSLQTGLTWSWDASFSAYPASTYTLVYTLINSTNKITVTASADGDDYSASVDAVTTAGYSTGTYSYQAVANDGTDYFLVESGTVTLTAAFSEETTLDNRSHVKIVLDAIEATLEGKASADQQTIIVGDRHITAWSPGELVNWRRKYLAEYNQELKAERIAAGLASGSKIKVKFV